MIWWSLHHFVSRFLFWNRPRDLFRWSVNHLVEFIKLFEFENWHRNLKRWTNYQFMDFLKIKFGIEIWKSDQVISWMIFVEYEIGIEILINDKLYIWKNVFSPSKKIILKKGKSPIFFFIFDRGSFIFLYSEQMLYE